MEKILVLLGLLGLCFARPDIGLKLRQQQQQQQQNLHQFHTSYGVPSESVTALPPVVQSYLPPSPTYQTPLVSTAVPFYSPQALTITPTGTPILIDQGYIPQQQFFQPQITTSTGHFQAPGVGQTEVEKHVYFYEAPEEPEDVQPHVAPSYQEAKKNVKIIFIKAPTYKIPAPYVHPGYNQQQDKTIVYVLVKKPEAGEPIVVEPPPPTPPSKPEVFFIKYKSQSEAEEKVQDTLNSHAESGANVITNHVQTGGVIGGEQILPVVTTASPILTNYVSTPQVINPGISITSNGINGHYISSTEAPIISSSYIPSIISSTEAPIISSTYLPSFETNDVKPHETYGPPIQPHSTYGVPNKK